MAGTPVFFQGTSLATGPDRRYGIGDSGYRYRGPPLLPLTWYTLGWHFKPATDTVEVYINGILAGTDAAAPYAGVGAFVFGWATCPAGSDPAARADIYFDNIHIGTGGLGSYDLFYADFDTLAAGDLVVPPFSTEIEGANCFARAAVRPYAGSHECFQSLVAPSGQANAAFELGSIHTGELWIDFAFAFSSQTNTLITTAGFPVGRSFFQVFGSSSGGGGIYDQLVDGSQAVWDIEGRTGAHIHYRQKT